MKLQYVKTSNHHNFVANLTAVQSGAAFEAKILLLSGEPGTGKSRCIEYWGSDNRGIYIEGYPTMTVSYVRDLLAHQLAVQGCSKFVQQQAIQDAMKEHQQPIIFDEAQFGLEKKAEVVDYLRRITEQAGSVMILVCHTSERSRFGEHRLAHIATRISAVADFKPASPADCALYLAELCEVSIDQGIAAQVHSQSRGRYRLMTAACLFLESVAKQKGVSALTLDDVKNRQLCVDAGEALKPNGRGV